MDIISGVARRLEVVDTGRRRRWSADEKVRIVAESFSGEASVCAVARRHGIAPSHLFSWRKAARTPARDAGPSFIPALMVDPPTDGDAAPPVPGPAIVIELTGGVRVTILADATAELVRATLRSLAR